MIPWVVRSWVWTNFCLRPVYQLRMYSNFSTFKYGNIVVRSNFININKQLHTKMLDY